MDHNAKLRLLACSLALCSIMGLGCDSPDLFPRQDLPAFRSDAGIVNRSVVTLPAGPCVILHFPPTYFEPSDTGNAQIVSEESSTGLQPGAHERKEPDAPHATTYNCVSFALSGVFPLGPGDWLEPFPRSTTFYTNPAQTVLDSFCDRILETPIHDSTCHELEQSKAILSDDIACYVQTFEGKQVIVHMGTIHTEQGLHRVRSKLGVGPVVDSTLEFCWKSFPSTNLIIYRKKRV